MHFRQTIKKRGQILPIYGSITPIMTDAAFLSHQEINQGFWFLARFYGLNPNLFSLFILTTAL